MLAELGPSNYNISVKFSEVISKAAPKQKGTDSWNGWYWSPDTLG